LFCVNLATGLVIALEFPGTSYITSSGAGLDSQDAIDRFDPSQIYDWSSNPFSGIPLIGDIFAAFNYIIDLFPYLFDGLPMLLNFISSSYITSGDGQTAFLIIEYTLRAVYGLLITVFLIEFISGRIFTD